MGKNNFYVKIAIILLICKIGLFEGAPVKQIQYTNSSGHKWNKPLNLLIEEAKKKPYMMDAIRKVLTEAGFAESEIEKLIKNGISSHKGKKVTLNDVSQFCCTL